MTLAGHVYSMMSSLPPDQQQMAPPPPGPPPAPPPPPPAAPPPPPPPPPPPVLPHEADVEMDERVHGGGQDEEDYIGDEAITHGPRSDLWHIMRTHPGPQFYGFNSGQRVQIPIRQIRFSQKNVSAKMQFGDYNQHAEDSMLKMLRDLQMGNLIPCSRQFPSLHVTPVGHGLFVSTDNRRLMILKAYQSWHEDIIIEVSCIIAKEAPTYNSDSDGLSIRTRGHGYWADRNNALFGQ